MSRIIMPRLTGVFAQVETWRLVARSPWRRMTGTRLDIKPATLVHVQARLVLIVSGQSPDAGLPELLAQEVRAPVGAGASISPERSVYNRSDQ
jgi:hypothetical protein